jgi:hypothetical protein
MYTEPIPDTELAARSSELIESEPRELWATELLEAGLIALLEAELTHSVATALLAAELMDAGCTALGASAQGETEFALFKAPGARRRSRAPRRA